jgi:hypothetical protein
VKNFAIDRIDASSGVTAIIDDNENLQLNIWDFDFSSRKMASAGSKKRNYALLSGATYAAPTLVDLAPIPSGAAIQDEFTANVKGDHLDLAIWRIGEKP